MSSLKANKEITKENKRLRIAYQDILEKHEKASIALNWAIEILIDECYSYEAHVVKDLWANGKSSEYYTEDSDEAV